MTTPILSILALADSSHAHGAAAAGLDRVAVRCALSGRVDRLNATAEGLEAIAANHLPKTWDGGELSLLTQAKLAVPQTLAQYMRKCASKCTSLSKIPQGQRGEGWAEDIALEMVRGFTLAYETALDEVSALKAEHTRGCN